YFLRIQKQGQLSFYVIPASGGPRGPGWAQKTVPVGVWTHVAGVYDATKRVARAYLDGEFLSEEMGILPSTETDQPLHLGADYGDNRFHGVLDEVRIYSRALSHDE